MSAGAGEPDRLAILLHEVRSPVAALRVIVDAVRRGSDVRDDALDATARREC